MARPRSKRPLSVAITPSAGRWVAFVPVGDGKPRRKASATMCVACKVTPRGGCACWELCADRVRQLEDEIAAGTLGKAGRRPTVEVFFTRWLTDIAPYQPGGGSRRRPLAPRTLDDYWSRCRTWIFPHVGPRRINELEVAHLDRLYAAMYAAGKTEAHVLKTHAVIRRGLSVARQRDEVRRNVAAEMDPPGSPKPRRRKEVMSVEQAEAFVVMLDGEPDGLRWKAQAVLGPRQGEVLAWRWSYLDLDAGTVDTAWQIQRRIWHHGCARSCARKRAAECPTRSLDVRAGETHLTRLQLVKGELVRVPTGLVICRPKTWADGDVGHLVSLPEQLVREIREHRRHQLAARLAAGDRWEDNDLVFCQPNGRPLDPRRDYDRGAELLAKAGLADVGTHVLRSSFATVALDLGVDVAVVQEVLGHADIRTTRGYTRVSTGLTARAAKVVGDRLLGAGSATNIATARERRRRREA